MAGSLCAVFATFPAIARRAAVRRESILATLQPRAVSLAIEVSEARAGDGGARRPAVRAEAAAVGRPCRLGPGSFEGSYRRYWSMSD